ncbi:MAG: hypothetical protein QM535_12240, partial [Limnohabitans sp.]|nr:hypothetical protein [Limnohabitans sp.]
MKRIFICLFAVGVLFGCSKSDDAPAPTPSTTVATDVIKLYNKDTSAEIKDGDVFTYSSTVANNCTLSFYFKNLTSSAIKVKGKIV